MNTKEQLNKIFRTDADCLLADFPVGHKFIIDGKEAFVTDRQHMLLDNGDATYQYTIKAADGEAWTLFEQDLWIKTNDRDIFMDIFRDADRLSTLSPDDRIEVFTSILLGSSDVTVELLKDVLREYSVSGIRISKEPKRTGKYDFNGHTPRYARDTLTPLGFKKMRIAKKGVPRSKKGGLDIEDYASDYQIIYKTINHHNGDVTVATSKNFIRFSK